MQTSFHVNSINRVKGYFLRKQYRLVLLFFVFLAASCKKDTQTLKEESSLSVENSNLKKSDSDPAKVRVFATGFNNPRGLKFGPDGYL